MLYNDFLDTTNRAAHPIEHENSVTNSQEELKRIRNYYYYLFKLQMGFYPVAVYYNKTQHTSHKITHHTQTNTAHKSTQTIMDTYYTQ
jgi:hypothetical protein